MNPFIFQFVYGCFDTLTAEQLQSWKYLLSGILLKRCIDLAPDHGLRPGR